MRSRDHSWRVGHAKIGVDRAREKTVGIGIVKRLDAHGWEHRITGGPIPIAELVRMRIHALVLNPDSVGWPAYSDDHPHPHVIEAGTPHARYAIADDAGGTWQYEFRAVEYDWEMAASIAEQNGRPDVARALRTGRV